MKTNVLQILKDVKEDVKKVKKMMYEKMEISTETENLKRKQIVKLKGTITEVKISLQIFKGRFEQVEELANLKAMDIIV